MPKAPRTFNLNARFTPAGPEENDARTFREFWLAAKQQTQKLRAKELKQREARLKELQAADRKTRPVIRRVLRDEISAEAAGRKIGRLVPDKELAGELFDHWQKAAAATPETCAELDRNIQQGEADLRRLTPLRKADKAVHAGLWVLVEAAMAGDVDAAKDLAEAAISATSWLQMAERVCPEVFGRLARMRTEWPVLADEEPGWERDAVRRVQELGLGADLRFIRTRFRKARGTDANLPARLWAKAAVRVADVTRARWLVFAGLGRVFGSTDAFHDFCTASGWEPGKHSKWADDAGPLEVFSHSSLPKWKRIVRQMIREDFPDFHLRPEWENQRRTAAANGRDSVGDIRNAILDDIVSALARLVPEDVC